jgi:dTDP-4-dehydrorhamnose 3,5-epimerase
LGDVKKAIDTCVLNNKWNLAVELAEKNNFFQIEALVNKFCNVLIEKNKKMLFVPRGFAHGFVCLSEEAILQYKCDNFYDKSAESGINFADPQLAIEWPIPLDELTINERDKNFQTLENYIKNDRN